MDIISGGLLIDRDLKSMLFSLVGCDMKRCDFSLISSQIGISSTSQQQLTDAEVVLCDCHEEWGAAVFVRLVGVGPSLEQVFHSR